MENRILCLLLLSVAFAVRPGDAQDPFTERPEETVVFVNDSAQLNCSFVTLPSFVVWQKGSEGIAVNRDVNNDLEDSYEVTGDGSQNQFHLRVIEAAVDLSGTYTCSDFGDSSITASADLIVIDGAPECSIHPGYTAVENEEITLVCMSSSVVDLAWLKDGVEVQRVRGMTHNLTTTLNKTDNGTRFDCRIVHPKLSDEQSSQLSCEEDIAVVVQYTPEVNIADKSNNITIEGRTYTQSCSADGNPSPDVYWQSFDGMVQNGDNLQISSIYRTQHGLYTCYANNTLWDGSAAIGNDSVMVTVQYPPTIRTPPSAAIKEGAKVTLNCTMVEANPMTVNFIWVLNDGTTFTEPIVDLYGVTREFTGIHMCTGTNTFYDNTQGTGSADLDLDVQCKGTDKWAFDRTRLLLIFNYLLDLSLPIRYLI